MTRLMLWILAAILFVVALALFTFLLWEKLPSIQAGSLVLGDLVNLLTALLTMAGLAIALGSFGVAIVAYQKSVKDSEEQQKSLNASRAQLQAVVDAATKQQEILSKNLETSKAQQDLLTKSLETSKIQQEIQSKNLEASKAQLGLLEEQRKREQEQQARKPIAEIALRTAAHAQALVHLEKLPEIEFPLEKDKKWSTLEFLVANNGNIEINRPIVRIVASPDTVFVDQAGFRIGQRINHNSFQFAGPIINDIDPVAIASGAYSFAVDITVPDSINAFDLNFSIQGKNLARKFLTLHLKVIRPPS